MRRRRIYKTELLKKYQKTFEKCIYKILNNVHLTFKLIFAIRIQLNFVILVITFVIFIKVILVFLFFFPEHICIPWIDRKLYIFTEIKIILIIMNHGYDSKLS